MFPTYHILHPAIHNQIEEQQKMDVYLGGKCKVLCRLEDDGGDDDGVQEKLNLWLRKKNTKSLVSQLLVDCFPK